MDLQYGRKVHGSIRRGLEINHSTQFGHLLPVRARICLQLQHISRGATAPAKRIPGLHARSNELRDGAVESPDQCGDACVLVRNKKSHIPNGTAKSVESHSLSNSESGGVSVDDCAKTEILVCLFDAVPGPGTVPGPETASNRQTSISVMTTEPIKTPLKVAFSALKFSKSAS